MFFSNKPKKPIKSLPEGLSEEEAIKSIYRDVKLALMYEKDKDNVLKKITSTLVLNSSIKYAKQMVIEFKKRYPDEEKNIDPEIWKTLEAFFFEGIFYSSQIYYSDKFLREKGGTITVPTGKEFEAYYLKEITKFDKSNDYADILIPKYLFATVKEIALFVFSILSKDEAFSKTSEKFKESFLIQYMHALGNYLASYLIQDSFT
jgi:hypothetical protein